MTRNRSILTKKYSQQFDFKLIERVKQSPIVYNRERPTRNHSDYLKRTKKQEWDEIGKDLGIDGKQASVRWRTLHDKYVRQLKKARLHPGKSKPSEFFRKIEFVHPFLQENFGCKNGTHIARNPKNGLDPLCGADSDSSISNQITIVDSDEEEENSQDDDDYSRHTEETHDDLGIDSVFRVTTYCEQTANESETPNETAQAEPYPVELITSDEFLCSPAIIPTAESVFPSNNSQQLQQQQLLQQKELSDHADDFFSKTIAVYLRQLRRRHKIKAEVEILQILQKYIDLEETEAEGRQITGDCST